MPWFRKYFLQAPEGDGNGGGGGGGNQPDAAALAKENADLKAKVAELEKKGTQPPPKDDAGDLAAKAAKEREDSEKKAKHEKTLEASIKFTSQAKGWVKDNASLLPKNFDSIVDQAEKEKYGSAIEKDQAIKSAFILEFFGQQANLDQLTASQKVALEDFKNLTKDKRHEQSQSFFDSIMEPTIESMKKEARARQVGKGFKDQTTSEQAYRDRRIQNARKQFLGEKN